MLEQSCALTLESPTVTTILIAGRNLLFLMRKGDKATINNKVRERVD